MKTLTMSQIIEVCSKPNLEIYLKKLLERKAKTKAWPKIKVLNHKIRDVKTWLKEIESQQKEENNV